MCMWAPLICMGAICCTQVVWQWSVKLTLGRSVPTCSGQYSAVDEEEDDGEENERDEITASAEQVLICPCMSSV